MLKHLTNFYYNLEGAVLFTQWKLYGRFMSETAVSLLLRLTTALTGFALMVLSLKVFMLSLSYSIIVALIPFALLICYYFTDKHRKNESLKKIDDFKEKGSLVKFSYLTYVIMIVYVIPITFVIITVIKSR
jgi:hypothetical protein